MHHLGKLQGNLQEIYYAIKTTTSQQVNLVANPYGTRLYCASHGWGRLWKWFYMISETFCDQKGVRVSKVKNALIYTHALYHKNLQLIQQQISQYQNYLIKTAQGYSIKENDLFRVRKNITAWNHATRPFIKSTLLQPQKDLIEKLFHFCLKKSAEPTQTHFLYPQFELLKYYQKIIDLEGILNGPLPLEIFEKVSKNKKLSDSDVRDLDKWIKKLNKSSCSIRMLHQALQAFILLLNTQNSDKADLVRLELMLEKRECTLFQQDDPKFLAWRRNLIKGTKLTLNGKEMTVGEQLGKKILGNDRFQSFSIVEMPNSVVLVGNNQAILGLKKNHHLPENGYGVEPIQIGEIFEQGSWAIVEKLNPLNTYTWTSTQKLSNDDQFFAKPIIHLIKWLIQQKQTPDYFSPKYLMINAKQQLKSLRPTTKKDFDFNALEDFAFQCASGNPCVFQHIMQDSGLYAHLSTRYYHEVISNALKGDNTSPDDLAGIYNIDDPKVVDRAEKLSREVSMLKQQCCTRILEKNPEKDVTKVEQNVNNAILLCHQKNKSAGILWPTLLNDVLSCA